MTVKPGLYIVSTPIGNLDDITLRAIELLKSSDVIVCEDTRVSRRLLAKHSIDTPLLVYNDKSNEITRKKITQRVESGQAVCLISDAGTPLISDPGYKLVRHFYELRLHVDIVPGVSAPIAALSLSGLPSDSFFFAGFLPKTSTQRRKKFQQLSEYDATLIFFESASRIADTVDDAIEVLGDRQAVITRELTKLFQERIGDSLKSIASQLQENKLKGEIVFLISSKVENTDNESDLDNKIISKLQGGESARDVADSIFNAQSPTGRNLTRGEIYRRVNLIKKQK